MRAGIDIIRVPYPSAASAIPDALANRVHAVVDPIVSSIEHIRAGRLRPLAVTTAIRSEALPDVPVMAEGRRQDTGPPCRPRWHDASRVSRRLSKIHCRRDRE